MTSNLIVFAPIVASIATLIFHAGYLAARVNALEGWRREAREDIHYIREQLSAIADRVSR